MDTPQSIAFDEAKIRHLEMVQLVVTRLSSNSFIVKQVSIGIVSAIVAFSSAEHHQRGLLFGIVPIVMFWALDAYYLRMERLFRALFNHARTGKELEPFSMSIDPFRSQVGYWGALLSGTVGGLYFLLAAFLTIIFVAG